METDIPDKTRHTVGIDAAEIGAEQSDGGRAGVLPGTAHL
jgi:hypothetical protein